MGSQSKQLILLFIFLTWRDVNSMFSFAVQRNVSYSFKNLIFFLLKCDRNFLFLFFFLPSLFKSFLVFLYWNSVSLCIPGLPQTWSSLFQLPKHWHYKHVPPCLVWTFQYHWTGTNNNLSLLNVYLVWFWYRVGRTLYHHHCHSTKHFLWDYRWFYSSIISCPRNDCLEATVSFPPAEPSVSSPREAVCINK